MVGRLVEQQHVGLLRQRAGDRGAAPLAARGGGGRPVEIDPDLAGDRLDLVRGRRVRPGKREIAQGREVGDRRILLEQHHLGPRLDRPPALVGLDQVGEAFEQGRLARPRCARSAPAGRAPRRTGRARGTASRSPGSGRDFHKRGRARPWSGADRGKEREAQPAFASRRPAYPSSPRRRGSSLGPAAGRKSWIPAFAGMTKRAVTAKSPFRAMARGVGAVNEAVTQRGGGHAGRGNGRLFLPGEGSGSDKSLVSVSISASAAASAPTPRGDSNPYAWYHEKAGRWCSRRSRPRATIFPRTARR